MQKFGLCLLVIILMSGLGAQCRTKRTEEPVKSTSGLKEITSQNMKASALTKEEKREQKESQNRSNKYIKLRKKISKHDEQRLHKEKELEYLEYRLELKRQKLEMLGVETPKGEEE